MEKTKMQTLSYGIEIKASKQKVWEILWQKESYQAWTQFFLATRPYDQTRK